MAMAVLVSCWKLIQLKVESQEPRFPTVLAAAVCVAVKSLTV